jgi:FkbM family methyltransferase
VFVKVFLKAILTEQQIVALFRFKEGFTSFLARLFLSLIRILPVRLKLSIKSGLHITKKIDFEKRDIFLNVESLLEYTTRSFSCAKEPEMANWFETFFREGDVFYDIGANVGPYSLVASKMFEGKIKVYAFEPGFPNFSQLSKNVFINNGQESIIPVQIALSDQTEISIFHYSNLIPGGANHALGKPIDYKGEVFKPVFKQPIIAFRLDDFITLFCIPTPNHIKIDVDGIEFRILKGAEQTLRGPTLRSLMVEIDEANPEMTKMVQFLYDQGFSIYSKYKYVEGGHTGPASKLFNYLFIKNRMAF